MVMIACLQPSFSLMEISPDRCRKWTPLLEAVRWAPTAANMQPCRVVRCGTKYHLYEKHMQGYKPGAPWDVQRIDMGIALCHLLCVTDGTCGIADPGIPCPEDTEYIVTATV